MRRHSLTRVFPFAPEQLFEMVGDVRLYPEFVPWLTHIRVWNETTLAPGLTSIDAEAAVGFSFLKERFATRVVRNAAAAQIDVSLLYGPFKRLKNQWRFRPHPEGTEVAFDIDFEFKSRILDGLLAANMDRAVDKLVSCFEARAQTLYGAATATV